MQNVIATWVRYEAIAPRPPRAPRPAESPIWREARQKMGFNFF